MASLSSVLNITSKIYFPLTILLISSDSSGGYVNPEVLSLGVTKQDTRFPLISIGGKVGGTPIKHDFKSLSFKISQIIGSWNAEDVVNQPSVYE